MERINENAAFEQLAKQYVEIYGENLKLEALELERQNIEYITPRLDKKVRQIGKNGSRRRYAAGLTALAAGLLLVLMLPGLLRLNDASITAPSSEAPVSQSEQSIAAAPEVVPPETAVPGQDAEPSAGAETPVPKLLPLSFALPENFTVQDKELDNGKSIYYLSDSNLDDVVLTMELNPAEDVFADLKPVTINDSRAYYKYAPDFSMLAFEQDGVTYVLTCKYDVNTLIPLGEAIL